jgi:translation initiation factor 2 beta subunit (eIF-2beta)/eIF-5
MINIGGSKNDEFYRYKRNKIEIEKQKGCTVLSNLGLIIQQIDSKGIIKFLQQSLGNAIIDLMIKGKYLIKGDYSVDQIEKYIEKYIKIYVLCPKCLIPEWDGKNCRACGNINQEKEIKFVEKDFVDVVVSENDKQLSTLINYLYDIYEKEDSRIENECYLFTYLKPPCSEEKPVDILSNCVGKCGKIHIPKLFILNKLIEYCWRENVKYNEALKYVNKNLNVLGIKPF